MRTLSCSLFTCGIGNFWDLLSAQPNDVDVQQLPRSWPRALISRPHISSVARREPRARCRALSQGAGPGPGRPSAPRLSHSLEVSVCSRVGGVGSPFPIDQDWGARVLSPAGSWQCGTHRGKADGSAGGPEAARAGGAVPGARTQQDARRLFGPDHKFVVTQSLVSAEAAGAGRCPASLQRLLGCVGAREPERSGAGTAAPLPWPGLPSSPPAPARALPRRQPRPPVVCCFPDSQDGVRVEAWRAGAPADPAAAQGVPVPGHYHAESRATSILGRGWRGPESGPGAAVGGRGERGLRGSGASAAAAGPARLGPAGEPPQRRRPSPSRSGQPWRGVWTAEAACGPRGRLHPAGSGHLLLAQRQGPLWVWP